MTNKICNIFSLDFLILDIKMLKKNAINPFKLIKYYKFINHNLIYNNKAINRYKKENYEISVDKAQKLNLLKKSLINLKNCELKKYAKNIVFGDGNPKSKIMLIGEAPGANEDLEGIPFVGRAGALLDKMLAAINLDRKKVYISNRGKWIEKKFGSCKVSVIITFHPAFLMRQSAQKKLAWIDLKMIRDRNTNL